ncbi:MAG: hypothetical protein AABW79_00550 [Nanoarchaeota archaeon]
MRKSLAVHLISCVISYGIPYAENAVVGGYSCNIEMEREYIFDRRRVVFEKKKRLN